MTIKIRVEMTVDEEEGEKITYDDIQEELERELPYYYTVDKIDIIYED